MQALPMVLGLGMAGAGGVMQGMAQRKAQKRLSQMQDRQTATIGQAERMASGGALPAGTQAQLGKYREQLRALQAEKGIFESGVATAQEAQVMPEIEQKLREQQVQQLLGIATGYGEMVPTQAGIAGGMPSFASSLGSTGAALTGVKLPSFGGAGITGAGKTASKGMDLEQMLMSMGMKS